LHLCRKQMVKAMSELSVRTVPEGITRSPVRAVQAESKAGPGAEVSARKGSSPDVSNYVTSPKGVVDPESGVYVLQYRDGATGEVLNQYPSAKAVDAYKRGASTAQSAVVASTAAPVSGPQASGQAPQGTGEGTGGTGVASAVGGASGSVGVPSGPGTTGTGTSSTPTPPTSPTRTSLDV